VRVRTSAESRVRAPSMHDVAALAGVSHQTVSRVVNDAPAIRPDTRARVEDAILLLGYRRNLPARALAAGRTLTIGVIIPPSIDYGPTSMFHAIDREVVALGYRPVITSSARNPQSLIEAIDFVLGQRVEGVIVLAPHVWAAEAIERARVDIPLVSVQTRPSSRVPSVSIDQGEGIGLAVDHLIGLGHVAIQHVAGPADFQESVDRAVAFDSSMGRPGARPGRRVQGDWTAASGFAAATHIDVRTSGVVCGNDQMAYGVIAGLRAAGRQVPNDVSVVGFDDTPESPFVSPPLTTVRQDFDALGTLATRSLIEGIDGAPQADRIVISPTLVVRGSTSHVV
jgi:DNA-binding LacI/PurR family transcriptional regulator